MCRFAWLVIALLTLDAAMIEYKFLSWTVQIRRSMVIGACVAAGFIGDWLLRSTRQRI
jgi:hypothetical protein